ncbi:hypothetical protein MMC14_007689 [Varicellaria rhodocarpa]|nr:hypothetical protein [Varicellaria rhodocarpa]
MESMDEKPYEQGPQREQHNLVTTFHIIPDFQANLMSMLTPAHLMSFSVAIGYVMTEAEKTRYMRIDRQIFKTTAHTEKLIKDGYDVVIVSSRLRKIQELMYNKRDDYFPLSGKTAKEKEEMERMFKDPGNGIIGGHSRADLREIANVWVCITDPRKLAKQEILSYGSSTTICKGPMFPLALPGTWKLYGRSHMWRGDLTKDCAELYHWTQEWATRDLVNQESQPPYTYTEPVQFVDKGVPGRFLQDHNRRNPFDNHIFYAKLNDESLTIREAVHTKDNPWRDPDKAFYASVINYWPPLFVAKILL